MINQSFFQAIEHIVDQRVPVELGSGTIQSINGMVASVIMRGSTSGQVAVLASNVEAAPGDGCVMVRTRGNQNWIVFAVHNRRSEFAGAGADFSNSGLVPSPDGVSFSSHLPGTIVVQWEADRYNSVFYEVQLNSSQDEVGAQSVLTTRGSYAILNSSSSVYVRIRAINLSGEFSAWTSWSLASPGSTQQGIYVADFSYVTPTATTIASVKQGTTVIRLDLWVDTGFNGGATASIGELGAVARLISPSESDLSEIGCYSKLMNYTYPGDQEIKLYITKSVQTTQGVARVVIVTR